MKSGIMIEQPLFNPADFRIPAGVAHVCAGGETAFLGCHDDALRRFAADKSNGMAGRGAQEAQGERARPEWLSCGTYRPRGAAFLAM